MKSDNNKSLISAALLIILFSCILRAPITGTGSLINILSSKFHMSAGEAGLLTTLPLLSFAVMSPVAGLLSARHGAGRIFMASAMMLIVGIIIRSFFGKAGIFAGTAIIGLAIAVGNVLLPAVVKSFFPNRIGGMTSLYTVIMQVVSALSTAVSVPVAVCFSWRGALGIWLFPAAAALIICIFNRNLVISTGEEKRPFQSKSLYSSRLTWWITAYMGVQSMMFYSMISWLSPMMQDNGYDAMESGYMLSVYVIMGMAGSGLLPFIMKCCRSWSVTGTVLGAMYLAGMLCMMKASSTGIMVAGMIICGFCSGTCVSFSMALFGFHTSNGSSASRLSGVAQAGGYLIAASGPVALGKIFELSGDWTAPMMILTAAAVFLIFAGRIVGREEIID